ncbi:MAG: hypothetical protein ACREQZ_10235 [Woeseiaceae bacterium]
MAGWTLQITVYALAALALGILSGALITGIFCRRRSDRLAEGWRAKLDDMTRRRDRLTAETSSLRSRLGEQEGVVHQRDLAVSNFQTELESAREREKRLSKDIFSLRGEREEFKNKVGTFQNTLTFVKRQAAELQAEFVKSREFYKGELQKSFEKRKDLERKLENAKLEQESFSNLLQSSRSEQQSVNKMLASAQMRLANLDELEQNVIRLEAENAQLNHDARLTQQEIEVLKRDVAELDELRVQNRELAHCVESLENSRRQHESDAKRHREHAGESEKKSETLRMRLDEVEKNFAEIENQQRKALREARTTAVDHTSNGQTPPQREVDDLQEIVGIGKVFERALHDLGIYSFRQIASFGPADVARVNRELKECRGRLEQDDWIGQAKDLLFKKYGTTENC